MVIILVPLQSICAGIAIGCGGTSFTRPESHETIWCKFWMAQLLRNGGSKLILAKEKSISVLLRKESWERGGNIKVCWRVTAEQYRRNHCFFCGIQAFYNSKESNGTTSWQIVLVSDLVETTNINCTHAKNEQKQRLWKILFLKLQHIRMLLALKV